MLSASVHIIIQYNCILPALSLFIAPRANAQSKKTKMWVCVYEQTTSGEGKTPFDSTKRPTVDIIWGWWWFGEGGRILGTLHTAEFVASGLI